jgi:hypothetical protein
MHHGFKFKYAIPAEADQHGFGKYKDYGGTIITPDGITIVMVHHEHTWRLPTFALLDISSKGFACLPCDPNDIFSSHYSANSFAVLNCLDTEKTCPEEADQQLVMQSAGASYVQPQAGDETHREYLEILYNKRSDAAALCFRTLQRQETTAIFGKTQHPASPFAQIHQWTHMSGMPAFVRTPAVPYSEIYSQQQQAIGS